MVTASSLSPVLAAASRWLTGQMPQIRAVMAAISGKGLPSQKRSKPRNSTTWNRAVSTAPVPSRWMEILAWPSMRVTGSIVIVRWLALVALVVPSRVPSGESAIGGIPLTKTDQLGPAELGPQIVQQGLQGGPDAGGRGRTAR